MKPLVNVFVCTALFCAGMNLLSAQRGPLLIMSSVQLNCVKIQGKSTHVLSVTLDNLSFSSYGQVVEYEIVGGVYTNSNPLKLTSASANANMSQNPQVFPLNVYLTVGTTYTISSKAPSVGGNNTLTFVPGPSLCIPIGTAEVGGEPSLLNKPCPTLVNLVPNGNFSKGNDGSFSSDLPLRCNACVHTSYCVGSQFTNKCSSWPANSFDHTVNNTSGSYLLVDGNPSQPSTVWYTKVDVCKGITYTFSFWAKSIYPEQFTLGMMIDDINIPKLSPTIATSTWQQYTVTWPCTSTGQIRIGIKQLTPGHKRDFGVDDIFFGFCCECKPMP